MFDWHVVLPTALLLLVGSIAILVAQRFLATYLRRIARHSPMTTGTAVFLRRSIVSALWVVLILLVLRQVGVNVDGIWTILASTLAVVGVGLLAVWTMVSNITASFFIWIWRPYEMGEFIELLPDALKGRAVDRSLMYTSLREEDGTVLMIPNNMFFQRIIRRKTDATHLTEYESWESERGKDGGAAGHAATATVTAVAAAAATTSAVTDDSEGGNSSSS